MAVSPSMTFNAKGNILNASSVAASGTSTNAVDASNKFEVQIQIECAFGTVAATNGCQVSVYRRFGAGPTDDTIAALTFVIPGTTSTTKDQSIALPTGKYDVVITNLDGTNAITVTITTSTVDSVG